MLETSTLYQQLSRDPNHRYEHRVTIAGVPYGMDRITALRISRSLFSQVSVGNCCAATLQLTVCKQTDPPKMAEIVVESRVCVRDQTSEYLPRGTFYINTRKEADGLLTIEAFDAMPKAEAVYFTTGEWEDISMPACAAEIAERMGVTLDPRTVLHADYMVRFPGDMTMREALAYIAAAHGGNWSITPENRLHLTPLFSLPPETYYMVNEAGDSLLLGGMKWKVKA